MAVEQVNKYRSPIVLGLLILFLLLFAFFMLGVRPANQEIKDQESELSQLNEQNTLLATKIDERQNGTSPDVEEAELLAKLPGGDGSEQLILDLRAIGSTTNARLKDIGFALGETNPIQEMTGASEVAFPTVKQLKMTAIVEGNYASVRSWLSELQLLPRIINVDALSFQQSEGAAVNGNSGSIISANVSFTAYYEDSLETETQAAAN